MVRNLVEVSEGESWSGSVPSALRCQMLRVAEVAKITDASERQVWRWIAGGKLKATRLGPKTVRVAVQDLERFIREGQN